MSMINGILSSFSQYFFRTQLFYRIQLTMIPLKYLSSAVMRLSSFKILDINTFSCLSIVCINQSVFFFLCSFCYVASVRKEIQDETDRITGKTKHISNIPIHLSIYSPNGL